jgi:hypothetical protein
MGSWLPSIAAAIIVLATCSCGESASERAAREAAAAAAEAAAVQAREQTAARREADRLAALWTYADVPAGAGRQISAAISSTNDVDTDGQGGRSVLLVFRDHPSWGRSSYLVLKGGDFRCAPGCRVGVSVDGGPPTAMAARRPPTEEAVALFINDWRTLWRSIADAKQISIEFPVKPGGTRTASFDIAGLDRSQMRGWDALDAPPRAR